MTSSERTWLWIYTSLVMIWPLRLIVVLIVERLTDYLTPNSPRFVSDTPPLVTAIIPAKDEKGTLADCLRTVCAQSYPRLEILVVNDRSTDNTAAIAQTFADTDPRVRVITITELPDGWTGKTHTACNSLRPRRMATGSGSSIPIPGMNPIASRS